MHMNLQRVLGVGLGLLLGCGGTMTQEQTVQEDTLQGTVINDSDAQTASPPSGKARVTHLARGHNAYVGHLWIAPKAGVPLHRDPTEEYLFVIEGGGVLTMNGKTYDLVKGSAVFMPAGAEVQYVNGDVPTVVLQVFAGPTSADKYRNWVSPAVHLEVK